MVTPVAPGTSAPPAMATSAGLSFINVVGSVCGVPALRSSSSPVLGGNAGAVAPAGLNLSGLLPSGGLLPGALPGAAQAAPHPGVPFGVKSPSSLRPLNLLQLPGGPLIFNTLQQQQQQQLLPPFPAPPPQPPAASSPQQPGEQGSEHGAPGQEQALPAPHAAVLGLAGAGGLLQPQAAAAAVLAAPNGYGGGGGTNSPATSSPAHRQPVKK